MSIRVLALGRAHWLVLMSLMCGPIFAQENVVGNAGLLASQSDASVSNPSDQPLDSPRTALSRILDALASGSEADLRAEFDLSNSQTLSPSDTEAVLSSFPQMLNGYGTLLPIGLVSDQPTGSVEKNLDAHLEAIGSIKIEGQNIALLLSRVEVDSGEWRWLLSSQTIAALTGVVDQVTGALINQLLPQVLLETTWSGAPVGQWLSMPVLLIISVLIGGLVTVCLRQLAKRYFHPDQVSKRANILQASAIPIGMVSAVICFLMASRLLDVSIIIRQSFGFITLSMVWIALFVFLWSLMDRLSTFGENVLREKQRVGSLSLILFFRASAKAILIILAVILVLDSNGVDVTTGLAALGIGGIALALGAQKTIENIVGSVTIVVDQPFRVGDFCRVGDMLGTIENIGLRSTRIRTLADTLVTFPNGVLSSEQIENYTLRRKFLLKTILNLRYETRTDDLEKVLVGLRDLLESTPYVASNPMRVRFIAYGAASLDVEVYGYIYAKDYDEFLQKQEQTLLQFSRIVESNGSGFAFPSQTVYLSSDQAPRSSSDA